MLVDPLIGRKISNFHIERLIGRGGMARVYYAWDDQLQRPVALKVIEEGYRNNPAYTERFTREASLIAALAHPNILQVYFAGEEEGLYFFAMEYIPGRNLEKILGELKSAGKSLPTAEILRITKSVANALDYAHRRGVIHRDIKPSNVIVADDGRIVLADFGLAMNVSRGTIGSAFGSPQYISPEQARNSSLATSQSDLYSFGVMLYEMLTGSLPFDDPSPAALVYQHISQEPPPPRSINPALSQAVERVLFKVLAKNPHDRYLTGRDFAEALANALDADVSMTQPEHVPVEPTNPLETKQGPVDISPGYSTYRGQPGGQIHLAGSPNAPAATLLPPISEKPPRIQPAARWVMGCAGILVISLLIGLILVLGAEKIPNMPDFISGLAALPFQETATLPTPIPPVATNRIVLPTAIIPTRTNTPTPTPTPTLTSTPPPTSTPTSTATPTSTPTSTLVVRSVFFYIPKRTQGLVVRNETSNPLALQDMQIRNGSAAIQWKTWNSIRLNQGECVFVMEDPHDINKAGKLSCDMVGDPLRWTGDEPFWTNRFDVVYLGQRVGTCTKLSDRSNGCTVNFQDPTPTPQNTATITPEPSIDPSNPTPSPIP